MNIPEIRAAAVAHQVAWEASHGDVSSLEENLHEALTEPELAEFARGAGQETRLGGHMSSVFSSSALFVNVLGFWRHRGLIADVAMALGSVRPESSLQYERRVRIYRWGTPAHLDGAIEGGDLAPIGIEAKYLEPFRKQPDPALEAYLLPGREREAIWDGLARLRCVAEDLHAKRLVYDFLDAGQLVKHALGLTRSYGHLGFELTYLWFRFPDAAASDELADEVDDFAARVAPDVRLRGVTYQELVARLPNAHEVPGYAAYRAYLAERYAL